MKFLVDAQLPPALVHWLRAQGHEAQHVEDVGLREANDRSISIQAQATGAVVITKDEDYVDLAMRTARCAGGAVASTRKCNQSRPASLALLALAAGIKPR
jgi:uncharacterized protein with PIN domain